MTGSKLTALTVLSTLGGEDRLPPDHGSWATPYVTSDERLRELAIRHAAFGWLDWQRAGGKERFTQVDTSNLVLAGEPIRPMPTMQAMWKPAQLTAALSFRTV